MKTRGLAFASVFSLGLGLSTPALAADEHPVVSRSSALRAELRSSLEVAKAKRDAALARVLSRPSIPRREAHGSVGPLVKIELPPLAVSVPVLLDLRKDPATEGVRLGKKTEKGTDLEG